MNIDTLLHYLDIYGNLIIFIFLFLGIVGIPAPEESLLFLVGVLINKQNLAFLPASFSAILGTLTGMLTAYFIGRYLGNPFINKYGKFVGISEDRWKKVKSKYMKNIQKTIIFGFYLPGIRQISPYFAGINKIAFLNFFMFSLLGTVIWIIPFILAGYYVGGTLNINPFYVPYLGLLFLLIFLIYVFINYLKKRNNKV